MTFPVYQLPLVESHCSPPDLMPPMGPEVVATALRTLTQRTSGFSFVSVIVVNPKFWASNGILPTKADSFSF